MSVENKLGKVLLVGAGPGPVDLMTVRAVRAVESAQALLYDALCSEEAIALAPAGCVRIQTGKRAGKPSMKQDEINRLMLRLARKGLKVVRLKGGDPSIFGRVGEEAAFLKGFGVETEVVPGVTAACAAAARLGIPLTHRDLAHGVHFLTGHGKEEGLAPQDWAALAASPGTLAVYMGARTLPLFSARLIAAGMAGTMPALAIENATLPGERTVAGSLASLPEQVQAFGLTGPTLILIGAVVTLRTTVEDEAPALNPAS